MQYLKPKFTVLPASKVDVVCEACVYPKAAARRGIAHTCRMERADTPAAVEIWKMVDMVARRGRGEL